MSAKTNGQVAPHDLGAERALVAAMMSQWSALETADRLVSASDFYSPGLALMFDSLLRQYAAGQWPDARVVIDDLRNRGLLDSVGGPGEVIAVQAVPASSASAERYAAIIAAHALRRRLVSAAQDLISAAALGDPLEVLDAHYAALAGLSLPLGEGVDGLMLLDELLDRSEDQRAPWVIPGLIRRDWRIVVVASEGAGKSQALQQIAMCASQGIHPFALTACEPVTALMVDAENSEDRIFDGCTLVRDQARRTRGTWEPRTWLWHRPGGLDLRSRRDRVAFEKVLQQTRPQLVCAGPSYKLAERLPREGWDESARAVQVVLDDLRVRYGFGLIMEDHAPQSDGKNKRDLRPFGSSLWLRWPELGIKLIRNEDKADTNLTVGHWRGARLQHSWPDELHRGAAGSFPWTGKWTDGMELQVDGEVPAGMVKTTRRRRT